MVVSELRGEKIDIIPWNPEPARFIAKALSPARVREVFLDDENKEATVITPDDQLALAIGKEGMNARLAARLTGWKVDITSDTEFAQQEAQAAFAGDRAEGGDDFSGRCMAILSNGKRCPNAALPGTKYCGVAAHQALVGTEVEPAEASAVEGLPDATQAEVESIPPAKADEELEFELHEGPEHVEDDPHGGVPIEDGPVPEQLETPVTDVDGEPEDLPIPAPVAEGGIDPEEGERF
jgi:N utilization substance protein A